MQYSNDTREIGLFFPFSSLFFLHRYIYIYSFNHIFNSIFPSASITNSFILHLDIASSSLSLPPSIFSSPLPQPRSSLLHHHPVSSSSLKHRSFLYFLLVYSHISPFGLPLIFFPMPFTLLPSTILLLPSSFLSSSSFSSSFSSTLPFSHHPGTHEEDSSTLTCLPSPHSRLSVELASEPHQSADLDPFGGLEPERTKGRERGKG